MSLTMYVNNGTCNNLTSGYDSDKMIGDALGSMTEDIAAVDDVYNSSYWCYTKRMKLWGALWYICENVVCPYQTTEYICCKYVIDYLTKKRSVACNQQHHYLGAVWWLLPIFLGEILWAYYPLLLSFVGTKISTVSGRCRAGVRSVELEDFLNNSDDNIADKFVRSTKHGTPFTFVETVCHPFLICNFNGRVFSRIFRLVIILAPLIIMITKVVLHYKYENEFVKAAVRKGALLGFVSLLAGFKSSSQYFLVIFGGPFVALFLYAVFGCVLIQIPNNLEMFLEKGLTSLENRALSPLTLSFNSRRMLAGVRQNTTGGFEKIHTTFLSNFLMLLNVKFWKHTLKLFVVRWQLNIYPYIVNITGNSCLSILVSFILLFPYMIGCVLEMLAALVYFALPVVSCLFILIKAYVKTTKDAFRCQSNLARLLSYMLILVIVLALCFTWLIFCYLFFDCVWFLTMIATYTYTGVIAYPKLSYGYLILAFMTIYYIVDVFNRFGESYRDLLKISIKACRKIEDPRVEDVLCDNGILKQMWEYIIERHQPRRIKVASTILQLTVVISILTISVDLLNRFNKFQELSLVSHVFTVLMICALPKILKSLYLDRLCYRERRTVLKEIKQSVMAYLDGDIEENIPIYNLINLAEYEEISD